MSDLYRNQGGKAVLVMSSAGFSAAQEERLETMEQGSTQIEQRVTALEKADGIQGAAIEEMLGDVDGLSSSYGILRSTTVDGVAVGSSQAVSHYGLCSTTSDTVEKTVPCTGFNLIIGARITVKFTHSNTASNTTLEVENTGARRILYRGSTVSGMFIANGVYEFVYDGSDYNLVGTVDTDTDTDIKVTVKSGSTTKAYITGATSENMTGTLVVDTGVYLDTEAGAMVAKTYKTASGIEIY